MAHRYSLAYLTVPGLAPPEMVDVAARIGYSFVGLRLNRTTEEEPHYPLMDDAALRRATKERLDATGIGVWDVEVARLWPDTEPESYQDFFETGAELGARHVVAQLPDPELARATERFGRLCELAAGYGLGVDLEFIAWTPISSLAAAAQIVRKVNQPNAGILVDMLHFKVAGSTIRELCSLPSGWFRYVHVCDSPRVNAEERDRLFHIMRHEREFPGRGAIDVGCVLECLDEDVVYALEIPGDSLAAEVGLEEYARRALSATEDYLKARRPFTNEQEEKTG